MAETMRRLFAADAAEQEADAQTGEKWQSLARARRKTVSSLQNEAYYIAEIAKKYRLKFSQYTNITGVHAWCLDLDIKDVDLRFPGRAWYLPTYFNDVLRYFNEECEKEKPDWNNLDSPFHKAVRNIENNGIYIGFDLSRRGKEKIWIVDTLVPEGVVRGLNERIKNQ